MNKNPETDIGVQTENQKSKIAKPLEKSYLYQGWASIDSLSLLSFYIPSSAGIKGI